MIELPIATALGREEQHNFNIAAYGDHGSGKSSYVEEILVSKKERWYVVDTTGHDYAQENFCKACGIEYDAIVTDLKEIPQFVTRPKFRIIVRAHDQEMRALEIFKYNSMRKSSLVTNCTIVVEEIHRFMDAHNIEPELEDIVVLGRHSGLSESHKFQEGRQICCIVLKWICL